MFVYLHKVGQDILEMLLNVGLLVVAGDECAHSLDGLEADYVVGVRLQ